MKRVLVPLIVSLVTACSVTNYLHPYRPDVRQGNLVSQDMVAQLTPGMTRDQVRFVLGSPLLTDVFHTDRWDYVYRVQAGLDGSVKQRRLAVFFKDGKLERVEGDVEANDAGPDTSLPRNRVIDIGEPAPKP